MKLSLDYHGVIDSNPGFFQEFASCGLWQEVHIVTGTQKTDEFIEKLLAITNLSIVWWDKIYSLTDELHLEGHEYTVNMHGRKCYSEEIWNRAKAEYCRKHGIDLHIDDSEEYAKHFATPVMVYRHGDKNDEKIKGESI